MRDTLRMSALRPGGISETFSYAFGLIKPQGCDDYKIETPSVKHYQVYSLDDFLRDGEWGDQKQV